MQQTKWFYVYESIWVIVLTLKLRSKPQTKDNMSLMRSFKKTIWSISISSFPPWQLAIYPKYIVTKMSY